MERRQRRQTSRPITRSCSISSSSPAGGFNAAAPTSVTSANRLADDIKAPRDDEARSPASTSRSTRTLALSVNYSHTRTVNPRRSGGDAHRRVTK